MKNATFRLLLTLSAAALIPASPARADDITDEVDAAMQAYADKDYPAAAQALEAAAQMIRQKRADVFKKFIPAAPSGWTASEATSEAAAAALFGGGVTAQCEYQKDEAQVTVKFTADSPMLQAVTMMISNPAFATSDGGKVERIKAQRAIVKYDAEEKTGEIKIVVANAVLVEITGRGVTEAELKGFAQAIDYSGLSDAI